MENEKNQYLIYVRKSTEGEEKQARSIGDQLAEVRELVKKNNLDVVGSFQESQSAKTKGRPFFNEMLDRIEAGEANGIIAWHPDRLARNAYDGGRVIDLLDEGIVHIHFDRRGSEVPQLHLFDHAFPERGHDELLSVNEMTRRKNVIVPPAGTANQNRHHSPH